MKIILIAVMAENRVIGRGSDIPWHIPGEQKRFKQITMGHTLIMGRKTHESIGKPLPGRKNIIITRQKKYAALGCTVAESLPAALEKCANAQKVFIAGGGQIYEQALPFADEICLSILHRQVEGDIFFPEFSEKDFLESSREILKGPEPYTMVVYRRQKVA